MAITTAYKKIKSAIESGKRFVVVDGGTGAGKTYVIMSLIAGYCTSFSGVIFSVVGPSHRHLERGAIKDFQSGMHERGAWEAQCWNSTKSTYTFHNGSILEFIAIENIDDAHGAKRDGLFVNEANSTTFQVFDQLETRTRDLVILDFNPTFKFWAHDEILEKQAKDTERVNLTYLDNEALDEKSVEVIERHKPKKGEKPSNWWTVYGLGQLGQLEGNIYQGWERKDAEWIRKNGTLARYGLDFGFGHPTALGEVYEMEGGALGLVELGYQKDISSSSYPKWLMSHNVDKEVLIVADSARPEIIADIKAEGFRIIPADKDAGSVARGIMRMQERQIFYAGDNLHNEYTTYHWREKRSTGETIYEPEKSDDDLMDAFRYAVDDLKNFTYDF